MQGFYKEFLVMCVDFPMFCCFHASILCGFDLCLMLFVRLVDVLRCADVFCCFPCTIL